MGSKTGWACVYFTKYARHCRAAAQSNLCHTRYLPQVVCANSRRHDAKNAQNYLKPSGHSEQHCNTAAAAAAAAFLIADQLACAQSGVEVLKGYVGMLMRSFKPGILPRWWLLYFLMSTFCPSPGPSSGLSGGQNGGCAPSDAHHPSYYDPQPSKSGT
eukprot:1137817-Pelagomonas_calceolata.AAC.3